MKKAGKVIGTFVAGGATAASAYLGAKEAAKDFKNYIDSKSKNSSNSNNSGSNSGDSKIVKSSLFLFLSIQKFKNNPGSKKSIKFKK